MAKKYVSVINDGNEDLDIKDAEARAMIENVTYSAFEGADGTDAGTAGLVPAPSATDNTKFLRGDGTWAEVSGGSGGSDFYTPTLLSAPTSSTTTYTKDGSTVDFVIGQFCRVADNTMDTGYKFYQLHDLQSNGTVAVWQEMGTPLERCAVQVTSNQPTLLTSLRSSAVVTVTDEGDDTEVFSGTIPTTRTVKMTPGRSYSVSGAAVTGFSTPSAVSNHEAEYEGSSSISLEYDTEIVTVEVSADNEEADLSDVTITVTDTTTSSTVSPQQNGTYLIPSGHTYQVSVSDDVDGYSAPDPSEEYTAASTANASRTVTMVYTEGMKGVDLGLPSGLLWAPYNVGAEAPEEYGDYFSWGNTDGHAADSGYDFSSTYASSAGGGLTASFSANSGRDAARENLGDNWKMPSTTDTLELYNNTISKWGKKNGINGRYFYKKDGNGNKVDNIFIFIPASDYLTDSNSGSGITNGSVFIWTNTYRDATRAYRLGSNSTIVTPDGYMNRSYGAAVRAVSYLSYRTTIHVTTTDGSSNEGIELTLTDLEGSHTVTTDASGNASILLTAGTVTIAATNYSLNINQFTVSSAGTVNVSAACTVETVTVTVGTDQQGVTADGQVITINGTDYTVGSSGVVSATVPFGTTYQVSANKMSGYLRPATQSFTAGQLSRSLTLTYVAVSMGVYAYYANGTLASYNDATTDAIGVALITSNCQFVMDKNVTNSGNTIQYGGGNKDLSGIGVVVSSNSNVGKTDYDGEGNTTKLIVACDGYSINGVTGAVAALACRAAFGGNGYMGSLGEWYEAYLNKASVDSMMIKIGGKALGSNYYWTSTLWDDSAISWRYRWNDGNPDFSYRSSLNYVRAFRAF